jgi:hypothetical protein
MYPHILGSAMYLSTSLDLSILDPLSSLIPLCKYQSSCVEHRASKMCADEQPWAQHIHSAAIAILLHAHHSNVHCVKSTLACKLQARTQVNRHGKLPGRHASARKTTTLLHTAKCHGRLTWRQHPHPSLGAASCQIRWKEQHSWSETQRAPMMCTTGRHRIPTFWKTLAGQTMYTDWTALGRQR